MNITGPSPASAIGAAAVATSSPQPAVVAPAPVVRQSDVLKPALDALAALPDFDAARVSALRAALARGQLPFDPGRLAGLVQKFHAGR